MDKILFEILFKIITVIFFMMWYMWDKKVIETINRWVEKYIYDANEILFGKKSIQTNLVFGAWILLETTSIYIYIYIYLT